MKQRIVVGMSGGIDSSVAALLLKKQGYDIVGVQMEYWAEDTSCSTAPDDALPKGGYKHVTNKCCSEESMLITRSICEFLDIPFYPLPIQDTFKEQIVEYYLEGTSQGVTPNPCTQCNKTIKFGALLDFATSLGIDTIATGHYARITQSKETGYYELHEARDLNKDQSYFLYKLSQQQLGSTILPLGGFTKDQVRAMAEEAGLTAYKKDYKESQGLCFFSEKTPDGFLDRHASPEVVTKGNICLQGTDNILGQHHGLAHYTIGQRKGLDLGGLQDPYFVTSKDYATNTLYAGPKELLYTTTAALSQVTFDSSITKISPLTGRIRYKMPLTPVHLSAEGAGYTAHFSTPIYAIAPGQDAVFYSGTQVVGGGVIVSSQQL